jgi:hypothetical protein
MKTALSISIFLNVLFSTLFFVGQNDSTKQIQELENDIQGHEERANEIIAEVNRLKVQKDSVETIAEMYIFKAGSEKALRNKIIKQYETYIHNNVLNVSAIEASGTNRALADSLSRSRHLSNNAN